MQSPEPRTAGVEANLRGLQCSSCGVRLDVAPELRSARCPYCDSPFVVDRPETRDRPDPRFVLGFVVQQERAVELVRRWIGERSWLAPSGLKRSTLERTAGVYLPGYLYGAVADVRYRANIGEQYQDTETRTTIDADGNPTTETVTVTRTEWRDLEGDFRGYVRDLLVSASQGLDNAELESIEPFDLRALRRYEPSIVAGWTSEEPTLSLEECRDRAASEARADLEQRLWDFLPGDTQRELAFDADLRDEVSDLVLLPVWIFAARYREDRPPVRVLVNGQTGEVHGAVPRSGWRIALLVLALAILLGVAAAAVLGVLA